MAKVPPTQRKAVITIRTRYGRMHALSNDKPIGEALIRYGEWAQNEIEFVGQFLPGCEQILDIGSHIGVHTRAFARLAPTATIIGFEPQPDLYELLKRNALSLDNRIVTHQIAIGACDRRAFMQRLPDETPINAGAGIVASLPFENCIEVQVRALDSLPLENVGFIKLDVEGCELDVLRGAAGLINRCRPVIYCEVNTIQNGVSVLELAESLGYEPYFVATPAFNPSNYLESIDNMFGFANETAFILLPKGRAAPNPMRTSQLCRVTTVDDFATVFLSVPRYGDTTPFDRNASELRRRLTALCAELETARKHSQDVEGDLAAARDKLVQISILETALNAEQCRWEELRVAYQELQTQHGAVQKALQHASNQNEDLRRSLTIARAESNKVQDLLVETQLRAAALSAELEASRQECGKLTEEITDRANERDAMAARILALEHDLVDQRSALIESLGNAEAAERRFEAQRVTLRDLQEQAIKLRSDISAKQARRELARADSEIERARRRVLLELFESGGAFLTQNGLFGFLARRCMRGKMANALRLLENSQLFDANWYAKTYQSAVRVLHPAAHYLFVGGYSGLNPGPLFDSDGYLAANPDVRASGMNPLLHYLQWGARERRRWTTGAHEIQSATTVASAKLWCRPKAPAISFFRGLSARTATAAASAPLVDVIVPVYRSYDDTLSCLASILTSTNKTPFELIVIDDCSPEPEVSAALEELAQLRLITLIKNEKNLGFVGTVNRGMALHGDRDILLLNSDTLVFNNWLDRLRVHSQLHDKLATITPFTNNGTICSYPRFCRDNKEVFDRPFDELDRLFGAINAERSVDIPTGVGFCLYITRAALSDVGPFDEETFGRGYGEENDFCVRASKRGWRNLHALDVFVFHSGETSFAETAQESKRRGLALLQEKHPEYDARVGAYISRDPSRAARIAVDVAQLLGHAPTRATLCFSHTSGGGIGRYLIDYSQRQSEMGRDILIIVPSVPGTCTGRLTIADAQTSPPNLDGIDLVRDAEILCDALALLHVDHIEIHSTVGWSYTITAMIERLAQLCSINYTFVLHDYVALCPQINLINESGKYCSEEGDRQCHRCLSLMKEQPRAIHPDIADPAKLNIVGWRNMYGRLLHGASAVVAPSRDTADRVQRYFPTLEIDVRPHIESLSYIPKLKVPLLPGERVRVGAIGAIGPHKGSRVLLECARDAARRRLPLEFVVIGYTNIDQELRGAHVTVTGPYEEESVGDILAEQKIHIAFLPSVWPETFCYTLSIALAGEIPVCVFDLGAQAERLVHALSSQVLKLNCAEEPSYINDELLRFSESLTEK